MPTVSTRPPNRHGAILSTCAEPLATISPSMANLSSRRRRHGLARATRWRPPPPPRPMRPSRPCRTPAGCPFRCPSRIRTSSFSAACIAWIARPAVLLCGSTEISSATPLMERIRTPGSSVRRKPHPIAHRLDRVAQYVEADADVGNGGWRESGHVGWHGTPPAVSPKDARRDTPIGAAGRRTRRRPSPPGRRRDPARSADCRSSAGSRTAPHCR